MPDLLVPGRLNGMRSLGPRWVGGGLNGPDQPGSGRPLGWDGCRGGLLWRPLPLDRA